jgi:hypothetical protein
MMGVIQGLGIAVLVSGSLLIPEQPDASGRKPVIANMYEQYSNPYDTSGMANTYVRCAGLLATVGYVYQQGNGDANGLVNRFIQLADLSATVAEFNYKAATTSRGVKDFDTSEAVLLWAQTYTKRFISNMEEQGAYMQFDDALNNDIGACVDALAEDELMTHTDSVALQLAR